MTPSFFVSIITLPGFRKQDLNNFMVIRVLMSCDYENPWYFKGSPFLSEDINDLYGFVYRITNLQNGREYIGSKVLLVFQKA